MLFLESTDHSPLQFLNINDSLASLQYRVFVVFFFAVLPGILLSVIEPHFITAASFPRLLHLSQEMD